MSPANSTFCNGIVAPGSINFSRRRDLIDFSIGLDRPAERRRVI
jgi:hypothetical protein